MRRSVLLWAGAILTGLMAAGWASAQDLAEFSKHVTEFTLENGLHFIVVERHNAPVVAFNSYANVGAVDDPSGKTGLAHMFEHMAFKGTPNIGSTNWPKEKSAMEAIETAYDALDAERNESAQANAAGLRELEAKLQQRMDDAEAYVIPNYYTQIIEENGGEGLNAQTTMDSTLFYYKLPSNRLELWFLMESERFYDPVFREFYKERSVVREERRMSTESSPQGQLSEALSAAAFEAHPYHNPAVGWGSDIENFRLKDAVEFYRKYYVPSNLSVAIVGDIDPGEAHRLAEKYFSILKAAPNPAPVHTVEPKQTGERRIEVIANTEPVEYIGWKRPDERSDDDAVLDVINEILVGGRTGTVYRKLVEEQRLALDVSGQSSFPGDKYPNLFLLYVEPNEGRSVEACERAVLEEIERLKQKRVDERTLRRVKAALRADLVTRLDDNADLANDLNTYYWAFGDWRKLFTEAAEYNKVTADDIMRVARKYFTEENRTAASLMTRVAER